MDKKASQFDSLTAQQITGAVIIPVIKDLTDKKVTVTSLRTAMDIDTIESDLSTHESRTDNPHSVTKSQVGLSNVDNTSDANKPVSTAQATAIGVVQSDVNAHEDRTDNPHSVTKSQVGLGNANNTSDADKPVSTATQTVLNLKTPRPETTYSFFEDFRAAAVGTVMSADPLPSGLLMIRTNTNGGGLTAMDHATTWGGSKVPYGAYSITTYSSSTSYLTLGATSGNMRQFFKGFAGMTVEFQHARAQADVDNSVTYGANLYVGFNSVASGTNTGGNTYDAILFRRNYGNWFAVCRAANVETAVDLGAGAAQNTFETCRFVVAADNSSVSFYIDDVLKTTITTNIPPTTSKGSFFISGNAQSAASGGSIGIFDYVRVEKTR